MRYLIIGLMVCTSAHATTLDLPGYLAAVQAQNPEARASLELIESMQLRAQEPELVLAPEGYASYNQFDDKKPTMQPFMMGSETRGNVWRLGVRKQTSIGLGADIFVNAQRTTIKGASSQFIADSDFMESTAVLLLIQSFWRNGFGEGTRAQIEMARAKLENDLLKERYHLKTLLLSAHNAYWSIVSFNQIVKLQQENVDRAKKLRDYMNNRARLRLFDDTDSMQAQAALDTRELELQSSLDERAVMARQFNSLRAENSDDVPQLEALPTETFMTDIRKRPEGHMAREDFAMIRAQAEAGIAQTRLSRSQVSPQVDLNAKIATNGRDAMSARSYEQMESSRYPTWNVGIALSVPLDLSLVRDLNRASRLAKTSAENLRAQADFNEKQVWADLIMQKTEARGRYDRSLRIEKIQTELVKREKQRLLNGRATTFEAINFEQNLALAQIQRVRAELAFIKSHNVIQTFEAKP